MVKLYLSVLFFLLVWSCSLHVIARSNNVKYTGKLVFIENKGQVTDQNYRTRQDIDFKLNAPGIDIFIGRAQLHYQWVKAIDSIKSEIYSLDVSLEGANPNAEVVAADKQAYFENYYLPQCPDGVKAFGSNKIVYRNIYPQIDWVLYLENNKLKYDFVVHKGGNAKNIRLKYAGATSMQLAEGTLKVSTPFGSLTENAPYTYDAVTKNKIASRYVLKGHVLGFDVAMSDNGIVIDPQIGWATYYGGSGQEDFMFSLGAPVISGSTIATDNLDCTYLVGCTNSTGNIAMLGAHKATVSVVDGFVVKFDNAGNRLWSSYYGGDSTDVMTSVVCGSDNSIYIAGGTNSISGIATTGAHQTVTVSNGRDVYDGMLVKFDANGSRVWGTYYGGSGIDWIRQIAISADDELYITGYTASTTNIATPGAFQTNNGNCFLAKFNIAGARQWATYYSDTININKAYTSQGVSVVCDKNKNVYMAGITYSKTNIATMNTHQLDYSDKHDCYLVKFNPSGQRIWGTYYGGWQSDIVTDITCDDSANIYMVGLTFSPDSISTSGAFLTGKPSIASMGDGFLVKFSSAGNRLWGTYLGGYIGSVAVDRYNDISVVGSGNTATLNVATAGAWKSSPHTTDATFIKFDKSGTLLWGTYYGGKQSDVFNVAHVDKSNNLYLAGITSSDSFISTTGSHQPSLGGVTDAFLVKVIPDSTIYVAQPFNDTVICLNSTGAYLPVGYVMSRSFRPGNIVTVQLSDANGNFTNAINIGNTISTASGFVACNIPPTVPNGTGYRIRVVSSAPGYTSTDNGKNIRIMRGPEKPVISPKDTIVCEGDNVILTATPGSTFYWTGPGLVTQQQTVSLYNISLQRTGMYIVNALPLFCRVRDTAIVIVNPLPVQPVITSNSPLCEGTRLVLIPPSDTGKVTHTWKVPGDSIVVADSVVVPIVGVEHEGKYVVTAERTGCVSADSTDIIVKRKPILKASANTPLQIGKDLYLRADIDSGVATYLWTGPMSFYSTAQYPVRNNILEVHTGTYNITVTRHGCISSGQVLVVIDDNGQPGNYLDLNPNPTHGLLTLRGQLLEDQSMPFTIMNAIGQIIYSDITRTNNKVLNTQIVLPDVAAGDYCLKIMISGESKSFRFVVSK